jgi:predicted Zn-dependent protease
VRAPLVVASAAVAGFTFGCAVNPVTRRPELAIVSQATELELGTEQARVVAREMGLVADDDLVAYVRQLGERVAASSPRRDVAYAFHVVDVPRPNAFAVPGHVYVTRGLLALMNDEDELAVVLAHEVGHIAARHAVRRLSRALPAGLLTGVVSGVTGIASPVLGSLFEAGGAFATEALMAPYGREQEREADRIGQEIVARAGFDPAALVRVLTSLARYDALADAGERRPGFLDSHPSTPERVRVAAARAFHLGPVTMPASPASADAFLARLDGLVVGSGAARGVFDGTTFLHPVLGFHMRFPPEWKTENTRGWLAAGSPDGRVGVVLTKAAASDDPMDGVRAFEKGLRRPIGGTVARETIGRLPAVRIAAGAEAGGRRFAIELHWIALDGRIFQVTGIAPAGLEAEARPRLRAIAETFGRLGAEERTRIREQRLRLAASKRGESMATFVRRTGTPWEPELVAVVNGLDIGAPIPATRRLKIARSEVYGRADGVDDGSANAEARQCSERIGW